MKNRIVYLNGEFCAEAGACISVLDRGFLFGDGIYEVIPVYGGKLFRLDHHLSRLYQNMAAVSIEPPFEISLWQEILATLVSENGGGDQSIYLQITRGVAARDHAFPKDTKPTVFVMSSPLKEVPDDILERGTSVITLDDSRWLHCNIKAISLLPNILLKQQAIDAGATEAILIRDGYAMEGSSSNIFAIRKGWVITPPKGPLLLPGITRDLVLELCEHNNIPCQESEISFAELTNADEIWLTSSTREVVPVSRLNDKPVGNGEPGPVWGQITSLYRDYKQAFRNE